MGAPAGLREALPEQNLLPAVDSAAPSDRRSYLGTRIFSLVALLGLMASFAYVTASLYRVVNDSFVAPIIFSPDNDLVIENKLKLSRLLAERERIVSRIDASNSALEITDRGIARLQDLRRAASKTLSYSLTLSSKQANASAKDLQGLAEQQNVIERMTAEQEQYVAQLQKQLEAGLVLKSEVERQQTALHQLRLAALQNSRDRLGAQLQLDTASLAETALSKQGRSADLVTPEMAAQRDHVMRIDLDLLRLEADREEKLGEQRTAQGELQKIDELISDTKRKPIFRAIEVRQNAAFVPYTQLEGVRPGSHVFECQLWMVFACTYVGSVAELLPGEVAMQDPFGEPARGQYALLDLSEPSAARAKVLRVRDQNGDLVSWSMNAMRRGWAIALTEGDAARKATGEWLASTLDPTLRRAAKRLHAVRASALERVPAESPTALESAPVDSTGALDRAPADSHRARER